MEKIFFIKDEKGNIIEKYSYTKIIIVIIIFILFLSIILFFIFKEKSIKYDQIGAYVQSNNLADLNLELEIV